MLVILDGMIINFQLIQFLKTSGPKTDSSYDIVNADAAGNTLQVLNNKPDEAAAKAFINSLSDKLKAAADPGLIPIVDAR